MVCGVGFGEIGIVLWWIFMSVMKWCEWRCCVDDVGCLEIFWSLKIDEGFFGIIDVVVVVGWWVFVERWIFIECVVGV